MWKHENKVPSRRKGDGLFNALGIALAFGIAFGGSFLVRSLLLEEEKAMLREGGEIAFAGRTLETDEQSFADVGAEKAILTAEELAHIVGKMDRAAESAPHEPLPGQLSMSEAIECGRQWLEDFLIPHLGADGYFFKEYRASCYLMSLPEDGSEEGMEEKMLSYWVMFLESQDLEAVLIVHAVTGQVLDAMASCYFPVEYMENEHLLELLQDYTDSFRLEGGYAIVGKGNELPESDDVLMFQKVGDTGVFAAIKANNVAVSTPYAGVYMYQEIFNIRLYLDLSVY